MINEANYMEAILNCSKWNCRNERERKTRYPIIEPQTGVCQCPTTHMFRSESDLCPPTSFTQYCSFMRKPVRRRKDAPSSDATEMKFIMHCNPALNEILNQPSSNSVQFEPIVNDPQPSSDYNPSERRRKQSLEVMRNDIEEPSEEEVLDISDEDEWSEPRKKRKKRNNNLANTGNRGGSHRRVANNHNNVAPIATQAVSSDAKPFSCSDCGATYRSRPGLTYHKAHVHPTITNANDISQVSNSFSPAIEASTICDMCLGDQNENKKSGTPEELVSCHDCGRAGHPSCLKFTENMLISTKKYGWQCIECKSCAICGFSDNDDQLLFCDDCDRGFHLYCLQPPLSHAPEGEWSCFLCQREFGQKASLPSKN